jgi:hypothetical protein
MALPSQTLDFVLWWNSSAALGGTLYLMQGLAFNSNFGYG